MDHPETVTLRWEDLTDGQRAIVKRRARRVEIAKQLTRDMGPDAMAAVAMELGVALDEVASVYWETIRLGII